MFLRRLPASSSLSVAVASQAFTCCYEGRSLLDSTTMTCRRLFPFPTHCTPTNSLSSRCPFCCRFLLVRVWMTRRQRRNTYERECYTPIITKSVADTVCHRRPLMTQVHHWAKTAQTDHVFLRPWPLTLEVMAPVADAGRRPPSVRQVWNS